MQEIKKLKPQGFTLVELIVTLAIAGILLAYGIPSYTEFSRRQMITNETNDLLGDIMYARVTAIKEGQPVTILAAEVGSTREWTNGWSITLDSSAVVIREKQAVGKDLTLTGVADSITFNNIGNSTSANTIVVTHPDNAKVLNVSVAVSGMITSH